MEHAPGCMHTSMMFVTQRGDQRTTRCACGAEEATGEDPGWDWVGEPYDDRFEPRPLAFFVGRLGLGVVSAARRLFH